MNRAIVTYRLSLSPLPSWSYDTLALELAKIISLINISRSIHHPFKQQQDEDHKKSNNLDRAESIK